MSSSSFIVLGVSDGLDVSEVEALPTIADKPAARLHLRRAAREASSAILFMMGSFFFNVQQKKKKRSWMEAAGRNELLRL